MCKVWLVAGDTLREAAARRWIIVLLGEMTLALAILAVSLQLSVRSS